MSRKQEFLEVAGKLAGKIGIDNITRRALAAEIGCTEGLVSHYLGDRATMRAALVKHCKKAGVKSPVNAEAIGKKLRARGKAKPVAKVKAKAKPVTKAKANPAVAKVKPVAKAEPVTKRTAARKPIAPPSLPALN